MFTIECNTPVPEMAANSVTISVEAPLETLIQEITYDGQEICQQPPSMSENLSKLAQRIDFREMPEDSIKKEVDTDKVKEETSEKSVEASSFQQPSWPWESVRNKLRSCLTEVSVLADILQICKGSHFMVLDPVVTDGPLPKPYVQLASKKKGLASASTILTEGAERLKSSQNEAMRNRSSPDFHLELLVLRQNWRVKKVQNTILGDLSYRSAGSRFYQSGVFEVTKMDNNLTTLSDSTGSPDSAVPNKTATTLRVTVPSELEGISYIQVTIQKDQETICSAQLNIPNTTISDDFQDGYWKQKLEAAQNVLFCKELFLQLAREAVQLQTPIPHMVVGNQITASLFPGIQLTIGLCHSVSPVSRAAAASVPKLEHNHVLEHSLHQLLREAHFRNINQPMATPTTALVGISRKRRLAGPEAFNRTVLQEMSRSETLLEQIIRQAQHVVLRLRTMYVIDTLAREIKDPLIVSHWNTLNSPTQSCVKINITSHGYETLSRTSLVVHVGYKQLQTVCRDGRVMDLSYEPQELRDLILCQISQHQITAVQSLAKCMGWPVLASCYNLGIGPVEALGNAASCILSSPLGDKVICIRCWPQTGTQVMFSSSPRKDFFPNQLVKERKWENLGENWKEVRWERMEGKNFLNKMELLMSSLTVL